MEFRSAARPQPQNLLSHERQIHLYWRATAILER